MITKIAPHKIKTKGYKFAGISSLKEASTGKSGYSTVKITEIELFTACRRIVIHNAEVR